MFYIKSQDSLAHEDRTQTLYEMEQNEVSYWHRKAPELRSYICCINRHEKLLNIVMVYISMLPISTF